MTYTHITTDELVIIEAYFHHDTPISHIAKRIGRARQTVHNGIAYLRDGHTALDYYQRYQENKKRCGRKRMVLPMQGRRKPNSHQERRGASGVQTQHFRKNK